MSITHEQINPLFVAPITRSQTWKEAFALTRVIAMTCLTPRQEETRIAAADLLHSCFPNFRRAAMQMDLISKSRPLD